MTDPSSPEPLAMRYPLRFQFKIGKAQYDASVTQQSRGIHLSLAGAVATIPYSVEGGNDRAEVLKLVAAKGSNASWTISPNQHLVLRTDFYLSGQPSLIRFFTEAVHAALARTPASALA